MTLGSSHMVEMMAGDHIYIYCRNFRTSFGFKSQWFLNPLDIIIVIVIRNTYISIS